ncbi:MAG: phosphatase PAP2 family protein [Saprospiraceae bacterium]|nr:phosphatase PAP2 family protein [Saprospiraceae bacterium]
MEVIDQLINSDEALFLYLNNLGTEQWDGFWLFVTNKKSWIPLYALLLALLGFKLANWRKLLLLVVVVALLVLFVDQSTNWFKDGFQRFRPCYTPELDGLMRLVRSYCGGKHSFFSGHSSNSFAIALFIGLLYNRFGKLLLPFMLIWAGFIAYSRVYVGVHFPLDIVCGALWGSMFGYMAYRLFLWGEHRLEKTLL